MQCPTTELVFPPFPTLLWLKKKRAAPDPHEIAISYIYTSCSLFTVFPPWFKLDKWPCQSILTKEDIYIWSGPSPPSTSRSRWGGRQYFQRGLPQQSGWDKVASDPESLYTAPSQMLPKISDRSPPDSKVTSLYTFVRYSYKSVPICLASWGPLPNFDCWPNLA
jgi:hypothetical protein